ncbi:MAG: glutamine--tRNA ligase/YqeY domain fusion protein [Saprospiraceae bacterium]
MEEKKESLNFIEQIVSDDILSGKHKGEVLTRFPPEPNGYLHIGHTKAISISFEIAKKFGGECNLRFDDTNPVTEDTEYVEAIKEDIKWLGYDWNGEPKFASDYFPTLYAFAEKLIQKGLAYVDKSTPEEIAIEKGTPTKAGIENKYRKASSEENLKLFREMRDGKHPDGAMVLRAKIDMTSPNMLMRDPLMYRIKHVDHHRTGGEWCIYPMYDFAHGQSDSVENITHSLCSLEFIHHRPVYNWFIENLEIYPSRQIEFSRMNVEYMITSKRKMIKLIEKGVVPSWDDPRMPTVRGMKRKGYPAVAIKKFNEKVGATKRENLIEIDLLESCVRDELNTTANRALVVENPVKLIITNYPERQSELLPADNNPGDEAAGKRDLPFGRELWIEREDFMHDAPKKFYRLTEGRNVRLKHAYIINCTGSKSNENDELEEVYCTYYDNTKSGHDESGIKSKGTIHWVSVEKGVPCEIRNFNRLFTDPAPTNHEDVDFLEFVNKDSLSFVEGIMEPSLLDSNVEDSFQFMRKGYYCVDKDSTKDKLVFNQTVGLKSSYKKK